MSFPGRITVLSWDVTAHLTKRDSVSAEQVNLFWIEREADYLSHAYSARAPQGNRKTFAGFQDAVDDGLGPKDFARLHPGAEAPVARERQMFRPDAEGKLTVQRRGLPRDKRLDPSPSLVNGEVERGAVAAQDARCEQIHLGRAEKRRHESVLGARVELYRRAGLLDYPVPKDDDRVRHRHGLDLVMRHIDHRRTEPSMERRNLTPHLHAKLGVEIGQGLVEQEGLRLLHDRAADCNALALPARELGGLAVKKMGDLQNIGCARDTNRDLRLRNLLADQAEAQ